MNRVTATSARGVSRLDAGPSPQGRVLLGLLILVPPFVDSPYVTTVFISALLFGLFGAVYDLMIGYAGRQLRLCRLHRGGRLRLRARLVPLRHQSLARPADRWPAVRRGLLVWSDGTLRLRGLYLGLTTWFVAEALRSTISNTPGYTRGMLGLAVDPFPTVLGIDFARGQLLNYYYLLIALGALIMLAMQFLVRSKIGLAFRAIREDQLATESLGLNATRYKLINFTVACFLTGARAFYAHYLGILSPTPEEFGVPRTVEILTVCYVGGRGTLWGSLFRAFS